LVALWAGFDYGTARKDLDIPDIFDVMTMVAIGKRVFFPDLEKEGGMKFIKCPKAKLV
jgi:hypothetical protein